MKTKWFRERAKQMYHEEGQIEIDSNAHVSIGTDDGAFVAAWVWVPSPEEKSDAD
jgi:hypothetical protein